MILEICVDSAAGLRAALAGGADRIEICAALPLGGLTPGPGFLALAAREQKARGVPMMAMIRAQAGGFELDETALAVALDEIAAVRAAGLAGVVIGASLPDGRLDAAALAAMLAVAKGMDITLHRCFDLVPDVAEALDLIRRLGIGRVLTSGGARRAVDGLERLAETVRLAGDMSVMPGSGINAANAAQFGALGVREIHASCAIATAPPGRIAAMGFAPEMLRVTDDATVRELKTALG